MVKLWNNDDNGFLGHGIQFVAVHQGWGYTEANAKTWLQGKGVTFPVLYEDPPDPMDPLYGQHPIMDSYTTDGSLPRSYVIGRDMVIRKDILGGRACDVLEGEILDVVYMRDPVDVEMVMDVSNSMNSPSPSDPGGDSKLTMLKKATKMIIDFLDDHGQGNDRMGLVWFSDDASEFQTGSGQKLFPITATNSGILKAQIDTHETGTCTAMGAGLQKAFNTLSSSTQERFAILCTDGMQNIEPKVTKVGSHYEIIDSGGWLCGGHSSVPPHPGVDITSYDTCIHPIGVGVTANYGTLLQEIANETGGFYRGTDDPENDLDLVYFLDLCNCLAGGSPAVVHHNIGTFYPEECQTIESFFLNRSVRKISVLLSWKESQAGSLTFWLNSPDGTLLDLHDELKFFNDYCLATIYLPRRKNEREIDYVGEWKIIIRGETNHVPADYHVFVVGEDREVKYHLDFPRKLYEVGDILPIKVNLKKEKKPVLRVNDIIMETICHEVPITNLVSQCKITSYEAIRRLNIDPTGKYKRNPMLLKLEAMALDPRYSKTLRPSRSLLALKEGGFECIIGKKDITIPVVLERPGLHTFKIAIQCDTRDSGPIYRTDMISISALLGKVSVRHSGINTIELSTGKLKSWLVDITPRNSTGQLLGPGYEKDVKAEVGKKELDINVEDRLDGSYRVELKEPRIKTRKKRLPIRVLFQGMVVWKEPTKIN